MKATVNNSFLTKQLRLLADKYRVWSRIDHDLVEEQDLEYVQEWFSVLEKFDKIVTNGVPRPQQSPQQVLQTKDPLLIDVISTHRYNLIGGKSVVRKLEQVVDKYAEKLHLEFSLWEELEFELGSSYRQLVTKSDALLSSCGPEFPRYSRNFQRSDLLEECEGSFKLTLIDVEYAVVDGISSIGIHARSAEADRNSYYVTIPFFDYFFIEITEKVTPNLITSALNGYTWYIKRQRRNDIKTDLEKQPLIISKEIVHGKKSMYGFQPDDQVFMKITTCSPEVTKMLFTGLGKKYDGEVKEQGESFKYFPEFIFYEAKTDITNKFLTEYGLTGCSTIEVKGNRFRNNTITYADFLLKGKSITLSESEEFYEPRVLFYDIECLSIEADVFPTPETCPIIQISYLLAEGSKEIHSGVLCFKETPGYEWYETEEQLLLRFAQIIVEFDADILTGYNSNRFDMPYILRRMEVLAIDNIAARFSRTRDHKVTFQRRFKQSKQFGTIEIVTFDLPGRVMYDQMEVIKSNAMIRLRSYSLKSVCAEFLGDDNKEDLAYKLIPSLFKSVEGRQRIASYCLQDTVLLKKLDDKRLMTLDLIAQAKVQGICMRVVLTRGLVHRLMCKIRQYTQRYGFLIRCFTEKQFPASPTYQGATVISCEEGYYTSPVVVLDFASLYPSLIRSYNLDYTTLALNEDIVKRFPERFQTFGNGYSFVKAEYQRGLLPRIEEELSIERNNAKKRMKLSSDPMEAAVWNAVQGSVKIVMNSIYGLTGSPTASVPCVPIASSITFLGRENLIKSKNFVEANYRRLTNESSDAKVIYGDTDSIFILMPGISNETAIKHGQTLDRAIKNELFGHLECLVMEYEKVFNPFLQVTAKRYVGWKMEFDANEGQVYAAGLQMVKRDSALLCKRTMQPFFHFLLVVKDKKLAKESVRTMISDLFSNKLSLEDFTITKKIGKRPKDYKKTPPPHILAWQRMVMRVGEMDAPAVGERFEYIIEEFKKKNHKKTMAEAIADTSIVRELGFEKFNVAKSHYFRLYIYNPMHIILKLVYGEKECSSLLNPDNYQQIETVTMRGKDKQKSILGFFGKTSITTKRKWKGLGVSDDLVTKLRRTRQLDFSFGQESSALEEEENGE